MKKTTERSDIHDGAWPIAQLETISLQALKHGDAVESTKLFSACCQNGIFYVDLSEASTEPSALLEVVDEIFTLEEDLFNLPEEELMRFDIDKLSSRKVNGYKPLGRNHGGLAGRKDGFQSYALPKDGLLALNGLSDFNRPQLINAYLPSLHSFALAISTAASIIFSALSLTLELQASHHLQLYHGPASRSADIVRLLKYHPQPLSERGLTHIAHTDLGSLTFLLTQQFGLQIHDGESQQWQYVQPPPPGFATVNIGDCLSLLTNDLLKSCRHRVSALPGRALEERYSFAYMMRPADEVLMRPVQSPMVDAMRGQERAKGQDEEEKTFTSGEWLQRKYAMLRRETWNRQNDWILTRPS